MNAYDIEEYYDEYIYDTCNNEEKHDIIKNSHKVVSFPMNSQKSNMKNKSCDYKTLAIMTLYSNMTPKDVLYNKGEDESYRYIYKNKIIKFTDEIEDLSGNKINTIIKNMRKLSQLESRLISACKNESGDIYYIINYCDLNDRKYVTIEEDMLRVLINTGNSNMIKIYILLKYLCKNKEKKITREFIAKEIGLSVNSKNLKVISDCTKILSASGYIGKRYDYKYGNDIKCDVYYFIKSHDEWKDVMDKN